MASASTSVLAHARVSSRGDLGRGAVVPAVRAVVPRRAGNCSPTWRQGRSLHHLPMGLTLHTRVRHRQHAPGRHVPGDRWFVDQTYVTVNGRCRYLYRAVTSTGQVIDGWLSARRDVTTARTLFTRTLPSGAVPVEVTTDRAPAYPRVLDELIPTALHDTEQYANNTTEADHGLLKARLRPMLTSRRSDQLATSPMVMPSSHPQTWPRQDRHRRTNPPSHSNRVR